jgi:branched-chain amino acid transport system ATP-binding protein
MLKVDHLRVSYGHIEVLKGISFSVDVGEIVALIGGNGAGKTTTLSTISGLVRPTAGTISWRGENIQNAAVEDIVGSGLAHCPEGRRIFPGLTVLENLITGTASRARNKREVDEDLALVFDLFPRLKERLKQGGWSLSGGEQQMLAIGRALMANPRVLLMDEPSEGLAPQIVIEVMATIRKLKESGLSIVLVEQNPKLVFEIADDIVILNGGQVAVAASAGALREQHIDLRQHLGVF